MDEQIRSTFSINVTDNGSAAAMEARMRSMVQNITILNIEVNNSFTNVGSVSIGAAGQVGQAADSMVESAGRTRSEWMMTGAAMLMIGDQLVAPIKASAQEFVNFDAALHNVAAEGAASINDLGSLGKSFQTIGEQTGQSATAIATAYYKVGAAGFQGADGIAFMAAAAKTATGDQADLNTVSQAMIAVMGAYKNGTNGVALGMGDVTKASDIMMATVGNGVMRLNEYSANIAKVAPLAGQMGVSLSELGAGLDVLTKQGLTATQATNELNAILSGLLKPSKALTEEFHKSGIASGEALIASRGFGGALEYVKEASGGSDEKLSHLFGNIRALKGEVSLASGEFDGYNSSLTTISAGLEGAGRQQEAFAAQTSSAKFQIDQAKSAMENAGIAAGAALAPAIEGAASLVKGLADGFSSLPGPIQTVIVAGVALTGGLLVLGGTVIIFGTALSALGITMAGVGAVFAAVFSPITLTIAAIAGGAALIISNWAGISDAVGKAGSAIGDGIKNIGSAIGDGLKTAWNTVTTWIGDTAKQMFDAGVNWVAQLAGGIVMAIPNFLGAAAANVGSYIVGMFSAHSDPLALPGLTAAGASWLAQLGAGMTHGDFSFVDQLGSTLTTRFEQIFGSAAKNKSNVAAAVFGTQADIQAILDAYRNGLGVSQGMIDKLRADLHGQNADVITLVNAYIALEDNLAAIKTLEQDRLTTQQAETKATHDTQVEIDGLNSQLTTQQGIMDGLKETEAQQIANLQPQADLVASTNTAMQDQQGIYSDLQASLTALNDKQQQQLDLVTQQSTQISYQASLQERAAAATATAADRAYTKEQDEWAIRQDQLKLQLADAGGAKTPAGIPIAAEMAAEQAAHDRKMLNLDIQKRTADGVLKDQKNAAQDLLTPLQQQAQDIQHANDLQRDGLTNQLAAQKIVVDNATMAHAAAQANYNAAAAGLQQTKDQIAAETTKMNLLTAQRTLATDAQNAIKLPYEQTIGYLNHDIALLQAQTGPLQDNLNLANDRVKAEDKVTTAINDQTTAAAAQAKAGKKAAGLGGPFDTQIDSTQHAINQENIDYHNKIGPLIAAEAAAKKAGDTEQLKALKDQKTQVDENHQSTMDYLNAQKGVWTDANQQVADGVQTQAQAFAAATTSLSTMKAALDKVSGLATLGKGGQTDDPQAAQQAAADAQTASIQATADAAAKAKVLAQSTTIDLGIARDNVAKVLAAPFTEMPAGGWDLTGQMSEAAQGGSKLPLIFDAITKSGPGAKDALAQLTTQLQSFKNAHQDTTTALALAKPLADSLGLTPDNITEIYNSMKAGGDAGPAGYSAGIKAGKGGAVHSMEEMTKEVLAKNDELMGYSPGTSKAMYDRSHSGILGWIAAANDGITSTAGAIGAWVKAGTLDPARTGLGIGQGNGVLGGYGDSAVTMFISAITTPLSKLPFTAPLTSAITDMLTKGRTQIGTDKAGPFFDLGKNVDLGLAGGITAGVSGVTSAINGIIAAGLLAGQKKAGAKSPATLFADELGFPIAQGVAMGIDQGTGVAVDAGIALVTNTLTAMAAMKKLAKMTGEDLSGAFVAGMGIGPDGTPIPTGQPSSGAGAGQGGFPTPAAGQGLNPDGTPSSNGVPAPTSGSGAGGYPTPAEGYNTMPVVPPPISTGANTGALNPAEQALMTQLMLLIAQSKQTQVPAGQTPTPGASGGGHGGGGDSTIHIVHEIRGKADGMSPDFEAHFLDKAVAATVTIVGDHLRGRGPI